MQNATYLQGLTVGGSCLPVIQFTATHQQDVADFSVSNVSYEAVQAALIATGRDADARNIAAHGTPNPEQVMVGGELYYCKLGQASFNESTQLWSADYRVAEFQFGIVQDGFRRFGKVSDSEGLELVEGDASAAVLDAQTGLRFYTQPEGNAYEVSVSVLVRQDSVLFNVFTLWPQAVGRVDPTTLSVSGAGTLVAIRTADDTADPPTFAAGDVYLTRDPTLAQLTPGNTRTLTVTGTIPEHDGVDENGDPIIVPARQISRDVVIGVHNRDAKPTAAEWDNLWAFAESKLGRPVPQAKRDQIMAADPTWEQIAKRIIEKGWA